MDDIIVIHLYLVIIMVAVLLWEANEKQVNALGVLYIMWRIDKYRE